MPLELNEVVESLAIAYMSTLNLPEKYARDAAHVAVSSISLNWSSRMARCGALITEELLQEITEKIVRKISFLLNKILCWSSSHADTIAERSGQQRQQSCINFLEQLELGNQPLRQQAFRG